MYIFIKLAILLYTFLVTYIAWYRKYIIFLTSFKKFSDVLPTFTCAKAIANLWNVCLGLNILSCVAKFERPPLSCVAFIGNIAFLKTLKVNYCSS